MNARSQIVAPSAALSGDPAEDRRRDEVLCRLLNTPYRPIYAPRAGAPTAEPRATPTADSTTSTDI